MGKLTVLLCGILAVNVSLFAHPPEKITAAFDVQTKKLTTTIIHPVREPKDHFIERFQVIVNDIRVVDEMFKEQEDYAHETFECVLQDVKSGDLITLRALCVKEGNIETVLVAGSPALPAALPQGGSAD